MELYKKEYTFPVYFQSTTIPTFITYHILSKKELSNCISKATVDDTFYSHYFNTLILQTSIDQKYHYILDLLDDKTYTELANKIKELSSFSETDFNKLQSLLKLKMSKDLQSENWSCETCKLKKLNYSRNCPYLEEKYHNQDVILYINGEAYKTCPVYELNENSELIGKAMTAYYYLDKGIYPESGGLFDQTMFFIESSSLVDTIVKEEEKKDLEKMNS